jgi:hypothetical protein
LKGFSSRQHPQLPLPSSSSKFQYHSINPGHFSNSITHVIVYVCILSLLMSSSNISVETCQASPYLPGCRELFSLGSSLGFPAVDANSGCENVRIESLDGEPIIFPARTDELMANAGQNLKAGAFDNTALNSLYLLHRPNCSIKNFI